MRGGLGSAHVGGGMARRGVPVRLAVWLFHLALPLLGLWILLAVPVTDVLVEHHPAHFWLVALVAGVNVGLALVVDRAAQVGPGPADLGGVLAAPQLGLGSLDDHPDREQALQEAAVQGLGDGVVLSPALLPVVHGPLLRELEGDVDDHVLLAADVAELADPLEDGVRRDLVAVGRPLGGRSQ